jgi:hypothetical protein
MNSLPLQLACLALSQIASPAEFTPPAKLVPIQPPALQPAENPPLAAEPGTAFSQPRGQAAVPSAEIAPATATSPLTPVSSADGVALAAVLIQDSINEVDPSEFSGQATSLLAAIQHLGDTTVQRQSVVAYWHLSAAISRHAFARQASEFLRQLESPADPDAEAILEAARVTAAARREETAEQVTASQYDLLEHSFATETMALPWPDDTPLVGSYRTNFETLFGDHPAPLRLRRIHSLLPHNKRVIETRARAVMAAREARDRTRVAYQEGRLAVRSLLDACERLRGEQDAFVAAVLRYNEGIAEYALAVVGPAADPATVVSTLIKWHPSPAATARPDPQIQQASAEEPLPFAGQQPAASAASEIPQGPAPATEKPPALEPPPAVEPPAAEAPATLETPGTGWSSSAGPPQPNVEKPPAVESGPARHSPSGSGGTPGIRSVLRSIRIAHEAGG